MLLVGGGYFAWRYHPQSDLAALVGGEKIYWSEIDGKLQSLKGMILRDMNVDIDSPQAGQLVADLKKRILDALIQEKILLAEATRAGAKVTPEEVTARVAAIQKERALTDEAFAELLKSHGLTLEALRERVGRELLIEQAIDAGIKETRLSREEWLERVFSVARVEVFPIK
jgi:parvulin-like peptidyl-prolyl isomerase